MNCRLNKSLVPGRNFLALVFASWGAKLRLLRNTISLRKIQKYCEDTKNIVNELLI